MSLPPVGQDQILAQNVSIELAERSTDVKYPAVSVYCEKIVNQLKEKFRNFSGKAVMTIEVRVSQDRLEGIEDQLQMYLDAVTQVLDQNRGDWGEGMYYAGGYEAALGPVKHGGKNFIQVGKGHFRSRSERLKLWLRTSHPMPTVSTRGWKAATDRRRRSRRRIGFQR